MKFKKYLFLIIFIFSIGCSYEHNSKPKNIILMIGDGMGIAQITAGMYSSNKPLNFTRFTTIGLMTNHSLNNIVTDSSASATAIATGKKTYNRAVSVDIEKKPLKTIMEYAKEKGYNIGIVVTSSITDATPAAFISHTEDRENQYEIALDILELEPDIILGGGLRYFKDRPDQRDLIEELRKKDYEIFYRWEELINKIPDKKVIGIFADTGMPPVIKTMPNPESKYFEYLKKTTDFNQVRSKEYLLQMTRSAIMYLESKKKPFILMIEGSQIDWGGHNMDSKYIIAEVLDFDKAIGEVLDFAERDQNTLVIVTADHETSGFAITEGKLENNQPISNFETKFIHSKHTSTMVPVFSYGPGSKEFTGIYDNTDIFHKIKKLWF
jgi:alkaline phosphatase